MRETVTINVPVEWVRYDANNNPLGLIKVTLTREMVERATRELRSSEFKIGDVVCFIDYEGKGVVLDSTTHRLLLKAWKAGVRDDEQYVSIALVTGPCRGTVAPCVPTSTLRHSSL